MGGRPLSPSFGLVCQRLPSSRNTPTALPSESQHAVRQCIDSGLTRTGVQCSAAFIGLQPCGLGNARFEETSFRSVLIKRVRALSTAPGTGVALDLAWELFRSRKYSRNKRNRVGGLLWATWVMTGIPCQYMTLHLYASG